MKRCDREQANFQHLDFWYQIFNRCIGVLEAGEQKEISSNFDAVQSIAQT